MQRRLADRVIPGEHPLVPDAEDDVLRAEPGARPEDAEGPRDDLAVHHLAAVERLDRNGELLVTDESRSRASRVGDLRRPEHAVTDVQSDDGLSHSVIPLYRFLDASADPDG